jgi:predicted dehydrogenase
MGKYKIALIGCGWIGMGAKLDPLRPAPASHAEAIYTNDRLELCGMMDTDIAANDLAKKLYPGVSVFTDIDTLLKQTSPDAVVIATHPDTHCHYIELCSKAGVKLVLSEKPIAHDDISAQKVVEYCEKNGTILLVNHMRRFNKMIGEFRNYINNEYVRDTAIGIPRVVTASYDNGLYHGGTHIIDMLRFILGEVIAVNAIKNHQVSSASDDIHVDAILQFTTCNVMLYYINSRECAVCEINIIGERGLIRFRDMWGCTIDVIGTVTNTDFVNHRIPDYSNAKSYLNNESMMLGTYQHIIECLDGDTVPLCDGKDALETLKVIRAIQKSAENEGIKIQLT